MLSNLPQVFPHSANVNVPQKHHFFKEMKLSYGNIIGISYKEQLIH